MVKRKLAAHDNLKITIEQNGNTFHIKESSNFRNLEMDFTLGVAFEYSLADGTELSVSKQKKALQPDADVFLERTSEKHSIVLTLGSAF